MTAHRYATVWDALERAPGDALHMKLRADLMIHLQRTLGESDGTQRDKADALGISQPRLNDLLQGRISRFSLDALVDLVQAQGGQVEVTVRPGPAARSVVHEPRSKYAVRKKKRPVRRT